MWKWFKRLIVLVIVLFFAVAALLIPDKIDSQDQLKNVSTQTSLADLAQAGIGGASLSSGGVSTEINLDSNQFRQILKVSMADSNDETLQNSSVESNQHSALISLSAPTRKLSYWTWQVPTWVAFQFQNHWFCLTSRRALPSPAVVFKWLMTKFSSSFQKSAMKLSKPL